MQTLLNASQHVTNWAAEPKTPPASAAGVQNAAAKSGPQDDDGFSFSDLLDIVNPLQHLPVISTIYRAITHDEIKPVERIAGDTLYGGVIGFFSSVADTIFEAVTGKDVGATVLALFEGDGKKAPAAVVQTDGAAPETTAQNTARTAAQNYVATGAPRSILPAALMTVPAQPANNAAQASDAVQTRHAPQVNDTSLGKRQAPKADTPEKHDADVAALMAALQNKGFTGDLGLRAIAAYQHAMDLSTPYLPEDDGKTASSALNRRPENR